MSRMTQNQRMQFERPDLKGPDRSLRTKSDRPMIIYSAIAIVIAGLLSWQAVERIDGWPSIIVLAAIVMTTIGMIIAVSPYRRA
jgi:hypothetical protein